MSSISMRCSSSLVPSVAVTSACVSPRVNSAEPWVRGSMPTSIDDRAGSRRTRGHRDGAAFVQHLVAEDLVPSGGRNSSATCDRCSSSYAVRDALLQLGDAVIAVDLLVLLGVHRVREVGADLRSRSRRTVPDRSRRACTSRFGLPAFASSSRMPAMILRQHSWPNSMASTTSSSATPVAAGFHHHDAVLGAGDDDVELGFARFVIGRLGDHLAFDHADANARRARDGTECRRSPAQPPRRRSPASTDRDRDRRTAPCR